MKLRRATLLAILAALAGPAAAAPYCTVSALNLVFPAYDSMRASPTDTVGNITVSCGGTAGDIVSHSLLLTPGASPSFAVRTMRLGGTALNYNLFINAARTAIWGDGNGGSNIVSDSYPVTPFGSIRSYAVYGRIFPRQNVPVGTYADTITVTVSF
jgi:spore coat protein U-like protein